MPQYDRIAGQYDKSAEGRSDRDMVLCPSAQYYLGDVTGKRVLDLACGSGYYTRLISKWGAKKVVGIDISPDMIALSRQHEQTIEAGIEYRVADVGQLGELGEFDIAFAAFLLHYATSVEQLNAMCRNIMRNLADGGRLVAFNENPRFPVHVGIKYGLKVSAPGEVRDGTKLKKIFYKEDREVFSVEYYHYEPDTYETALKSAGFLQIEWKPYVGSKYAGDYWHDYLHDFSTAVLLASAFPPASPNLR